MDETVGVLRLTTSWLKGHTAWTSPATIFMASLVLYLAWSISSALLKGLLMSTAVTAAYMYWTRVQNAQSRYAYGIVPVLQTWKTGLQKLQARLFGRSQHALPSH